MYTAITSFSLLRNGWLVPHDILLVKVVLPEFLEGQRMKGKIDYYTSEVNFGADIFLFHYYVQTFPFNLVMPNCIKDNDSQQVLRS